MKTSLINAVLSQIEGNDVDIDSVMMVLLEGESHEDYTQVADGFAWFALEEVGRWLEDNHETEEEDEE